MTQQRRPRVSAATVRRHSAQVARVLDDVTALLDAHALGTTAFALRERIALRLDSIGIYRALGETDIGDEPDEELGRAIALQDRCSS